VKHAINIKEFMSSSRNKGFQTPGTNVWQSDSGLKIAVMNKYNTSLTQLCIYVVTIMQFTSQNVIKYEEDPL
jgi:hypothetical protein